MCLAIVDTSKEPVDRVEVCRVYMSTLCSIYNTSLYTMFRVQYCTEPSALICWSFVKTVMVLNDRARDNATYNWPCVKTGSGRNNPTESSVCHNGGTIYRLYRGNSLPAIRYEPHMKTSQSIAANCLRRIACFS